MYASIDEDVDDRVLLEDDRPVAGLDRDRVRRRAGLVGGLAPDRRRVDRRSRRRRLLGVARCRRRRPSSPSAAARVVRRSAARMPLRVGDREMLGGGRERAERPDAGVVGGGDHGPDALGSQLRASPRRCRPTRPRGISVIGVGSGRPAQSSSSARVAGDRRGPLGQRAQALVVEPVGATRPRPACPIATRRFRLPFVSATFWWISLLANRVSCGSLVGDERLRLGRAGRRRRARRPLGDRERLDRRVVARHRLTTCRPRPGRRGTGPPSRHGRRGRPGRARPCRSSASRASRSSTSSPTASSERQNS